MIFFSVCKFDSASKMDLENLTFRRTFRKKYQTQNSRHPFREHPLLVVRGLTGAEELVVF